MSVILKKDIVIPAGTVLGRAPFKTTREGKHYMATIGLSDNTCGSFEYCLEDDIDELREWFDGI